VAVAFNVVDKLEHTVLLCGCTVITGAVFIVTDVVALFEQLLLLVAVSVYVPPIAVVALEDTVGLCTVLVNPFGPLHEYDDIPEGPVRLKALPAQTGPLFDTVNDGFAFIVTVVELEAVHPPASVTVTV
jgi:hypothetical protein